MGNEQEKKSSSCTCPSRNIKTQASSKRPNTYCVGSSSCLCSPVRPRRPSLRFGTRTLRDGIGRDRRGSREREHTLSLLRREVLVVGRRRRALALCRSPCSLRGHPPSEQELKPTMRDNVNGSLYARKGDRVYILYVQCRTTKLHPSPTSSSRIFPAVSPFVLFLLDKRALGHDA